MRFAGFRELNLVKTFRGDRFAFASGVCTVVGLVADIMEPIAPFVDCNISKCQ